MPAHPPFPTIVNQGIPVLSSPKIVSITFNNDPNAADLASFASALTTTPYWSTIMKDYGVGAGTSTAVAVTATLAATYTDNPNAPPPSTMAGTVENLVATTLANNSSIPAPTAQTLYVFYLPATSSVSMMGGTSCTNFGGYHFSTTAAASGSTPIIYAIVPECTPAQLQKKTLTQLQVETFAATHEIAEAVTDPQLTQLGSGYYIDVNNNPYDNLGWALAGDGEVADLCVDQLLHTADEAVAAGYAVQRSWSIAAATAGTNPCLPIPAGEIYFNAAPAHPNDLIIANAGTPVTVTVDAFADGTLSGGGSWILAAIDFATLQGQAAALTFSMPNSKPLTLGPATGPSVSISSGQSVQLSVTLSSAAASALGQGNPAAAGWLVSLYVPTGSTQPTAAHYWPIAVTTPAVAGQAGLDAAVTQLGLNAWGAARFAMSHANQKGFFGSLLRDVRF
jgi:hypothetical protein